MARVQNRRLEMQCSHASSHARMNGLRLNTSRFPGVVFKLAMVLFLAILSVAIFASATRFRAKASLPAAPLHMAAIPYYSVKGDRESLLTLTNASHDALTAALTL